jgi:DNA-binding IclR family transcriptional regulator
MSTAYARNTDPITADEAAETVPVSRLQAICLQQLRWWPDGLTSEQLASQTGLPLVSLSPRLRPLEQAGLIVQAGTRPNRSGRRAIVWQAAAPGRLF